MSGPTIEGNLHLECVYQDDFLKVEVDETARFMYTTWQSHPNSQDFRHLFLKLAHIAIQTRSEYWLSDARAVNYIVFADQNWLLSEVIPMLKESCLAKFARLTTAESLKMLDVARVIDMMGKLNGLGVTTKLEQFTAKEAALKWLFADVR